MAQRAFFFNSVVGDEREYDQNQLSLAFKHAAESNGISALDYEEPLLVQKLPNGDVLINPGVMLIEGYIYHNETELILPGASYLQGEIRSDLVIVRLDRSMDVRSAEVVRLEGTNGSADLPEMIRSDNVYDMCLAVIDWNGTVATVEDMRHDSSVCGFIRDQYATHEDLEAFQNRPEGFATSGQGTKADNALPASSQAVDSAKLGGKLPSAFATAAQGTKADNALPATSQAVDSAKLNGQPASFYATAEGLASKANTTDVNSALALKANTTDVNNALSGKLDKNAGAMSANPDPSVMGVRNIMAQTTDLQAGVSALATGAVMLIYE